MVTDTFPAWGHIAAALLLVLASSAAGAAAPGQEDCVGFDPIAPYANLFMKRSYLDKRGDFIGVFEFSNDDLGPSVDLAGDLEGKLLMMNRPQAQIEFKDLNGTWTRLQAGPIEHYTKPAHKVQVKQKAKLQFKARLFQKQLVETDGSQFMLVLYTDNPRRCVRSLPFTASPARSPIKEFISAPTPRVRWGTSVK